MHGLDVVAATGHVAVVVLGQDHFLKAVAGALGREVHFADGGGLVAQITHAGGKRIAGVGDGAVGWPVAGHSVGGDVFSGHDGHAGGDADRAVAVGRGEVDPLTGQVIEVRRAHEGGCGGAGGVEALLVGCNEQYVGSFHVLHVQV